MAIRFLTVGIRFPIETSCFGGYDARGYIEIKSGNYFVKSSLWFTTGEIYQFYEQLQLCYDKLLGKAELLNHEHYLKLTATFDAKGKVVINGWYKENQRIENILYFEILSDQTFMKPTLEKLKQFTKKYGNTRGING